MAFSGFPEYLARAASRLGLRSVDDARRQPAVSNIASLVSQVLAAPISLGRADTIRRAKELRDGLHIAAAAASDMVDVIDLPVTPDEIMVTLADPPKPARRKRNT